MTGGSAPTAAGMYLGLAEHPDDLLDYRRSRSRRMLALAAALMVLFASLASAAGVAVGGLSLEKAVAASGPGKSGDGGDDHSGSGGGADDDDDDDNATANDTTAATAGGNTGAATDNTSVATRDDTRSNDATRGHTAAAKSQATGRESVGATDRPNAHTGKSTVGETDPGDHTGQTERV